LGVLIPKGGFTINNVESVESIDRNEILNWLDILQRDFDPNLLKSRDNFNQAAGWFGIWLFRSLLGTNYEKMPEDSITKITGFFSSRLSLWISYGVSIFGTVSSISFMNWAMGFEKWALLISISLILIRVIGSFKSNMTRMLTPGDPYFNSNAYKLFRPKEYYMFLNYFKSKYSFRFVYDWVKLLYNENSLKSLVQEHKEINAELRRNIGELKSTIEARDKGLTDAGTAIALLNRKIGLLSELVTNNEKGFNSAIDVVYRLRPSSKLFNPSDLRIVTPFSLFELVEDYHLYRHCEQGTTETPEYFDSNDPSYAHYSSVKLISSSKTVEYATSDREGRTVASYWIETLSKRVYIYNFHYDSTSTEMRGIIETKEMYRFIRGICIHLEELGYFEREGTRDANA
jgi:hypothetical protein